MQLVSVSHFWYPQISCAEVAEDVLFSQMVL